MLSEWMAFALSFIVQLPRTALNSKGIKLLSTVDIPHHSSIYLASIAPYVVFVPSR